MRVRTVLAKRGATVAAMVSLALLVVACSGRLGGAPRDEAPQAPPGIYVATDGDDTAPGTRERPLRTLQAAIETARPGDTVWVREGTYDERPSFISTGTADSPIRYRPAKGERVVIARGFLVPGSHNHIQGFTVTPGEKADQLDGNDAWSQIHVCGTGNVLQGIVQRDTYGAAPPGSSGMVLAGHDNLAKDIDFRGTGALVIEGPGNRASGGTVHHTGGLLALLGEGATLENMDLHDSGQVDRGGNAADGINLAGRGITIRNNRIHRLFLRDRAQHPDAIQWWNGADGLVIEGNTIGSRARGGNGEGDYGHIQFETGPGATSNGVIIRNNVFLGTWSVFSIRSSAKQVVPGSADGWQIIGNSFLDGREIRSDVLSKMRDTTIKNNLFTAPQQFPDSPGSAYDHNGYLDCPVGSGEGPHSFSVEDPHFMHPDFSEKTGFGVRADWRPAASSPLASKGEPLKALPRDASGHKRTSRPTVGAYECAR